MGEYEPKDSRNVTGTATTADGRWTGEARAIDANGQPQHSVNQQQYQEGGQGQQQAGEGSSAQQQQFDNADGSDRWAGQIREHMEVVGADGVRLGTVDDCDGRRIKLTKADSGMGSHQGHHHFLPTSLVAGVDGDTVRLSAKADVAYAMEYEEGE
jgi:hypothetical protein